MEELDPPKVGRVTKLSAGPRDKDALASIVDADGGRDEAENRLDSRKSTRGVPG
jgi:hypothetical protein